jgi:hypothetical protein
MHEKKGKEKGGKEKERKEDRSKANTSQQAKKEQKDKEKSNFTSLAGNQTSDPCHTSYLLSPTAYHHLAAHIHTHSHEQIPCSLYTLCCSIKHRAEASQIIQARWILKR